VPGEGLEECEATAECVGFGGLAAGEREPESCVAAITAATTPATSSSASAGNAHDRRDRVGVGVGVGLGAGAASARSSATVRSNAGRSGSVGYAAAGPAGAVASFAAVISRCRVWSIVGRAEGSRAISDRSTLPSGPSQRTHGGGSSLTTFVIVANALPSSYGGCPSAAVHNVAPSDHRSDAGVGFSPRARSGAM